MQRLPRLRYLRSHPVLLRRTINTAIGAGAAGAVICLASFDPGPKGADASGAYKVMRGLYIARKSFQGQELRVDNTHNMHTSCTYRRLPEDAM